MLRSLYSVMLLLLLAQAALPVHVVWHQVLELGVVGATLALYVLWRWRNAAALEDERILQNIAKQATTPRQTPLTQVQAHYLVAQERRKNEMSS